MNFISKILGYRDFSKKNEIIEELKKYNFSDFGDKEKLDNVNQLIFFQTRRQQTWLFASNENLYCVLDDITLNSFEIKWNIIKSKLIHNEEVVLKLIIDDSFSEKSGKIDFGKQHKGWLYSKSIFKKPLELEESIHNLLLSSMT
ncbi:hypothetical protein [Flavobacterium sp. 2]|uniref:hypothetical protein n=1 Tax=Flavobacterium sp. 2 TaxID=308053 RepID=UPI000C176284|nr:hypothetical protein [Flavobacterium sp. 2]PIF69449.1 hypothetical protein CLU99_0154 [Flavobacterium sp. 2]